VKTYKTQIPRLHLIEILIQGVQAKPGNLSVLIKKGSLRICLLVAFFFALLFCLIYLEMDSRCVAQAGLKFWGSSRSLQVTILRQSSCLSVPSS
jgi:hypothetical protein